MGRERERTCVMRALKVLARIMDTNTSSNIPIMGLYIAYASQRTNYENDALDDPHKKLAGNVPSLPAADRRIFLAKLNTFISLDFFGLSFTKSSRVGKQRA